MFIRTERLFLRPAWEEDAAAITSAIAHEKVVRMLSSVPWPYGMADAKAWIAREERADLPSLLLTLPEEGGAIIGTCGLHEADGQPAVGYWITPRYWNRGFATEALKGVVELAGALGHRRLTARHAQDNPASGRVLRKAGFRPTGAAGSFRSLGRQAEVAALEYEAELEPDMPAVRRPLTGWPVAQAYPAGILAAA